MDPRPNPFKHALAAGQRQIGLWLSIASPYANEAVGDAGFDWLLIDMEHTPTSIETALGQLQALAPYPGAAIVRPASNDAVRIKHLLDIGALTLLVPYVQSVEEARAAVAAIRYPPAGIRGVAGTTRAARFGRVKDYGRRAEEEICLLLQVETEEALTQLEAIAGTDGVDGVFIGPGDLAASMGFVGQPGHPQVKAAILDAIARLVAIGKPAGILTPDAAFARTCLDAGALFVAVGSDVGLLVKGADALRESFR
jgi:4-hydroxy-2-oxoheptanedioate aldolase